MMHFQGVGTVLQRVLYALRRGGQLSRLPDGDQPCPERECDGRAEQKATRFDRHDARNAPSAVRLRHRLDSLTEKLDVQEHRRDVLEHDPGLREVVDIPDRALQLVDQLRFIGYQMTSARRATVALEAVRRHPRARAMDRAATAPPTCPVPTPGPEKLLQPIHRAGSARTRRA